MLAWLALYNNTGNVVVSNGKVPLNLINTLLPAQPNVRIVNAF
jgi:hypothetical protein